MSGLKNNLGPLRGIPGVDGVWHREDCDIVRFADGKFVRVPRLHSKQLREDAERLRLRARVFDAVAVAKEVGADGW